MPVREGSKPSTRAPSPGFISRTGTPRSHAKHSSLRRFDLFAGGSASVVGNLGCEAKCAVFDPKVFRQRWRLSSRYCLASPRRPSSVNSQLYGVVQTPVRGPPPSPSIMEGVEQGTSKPKWRELGKQIPHGPVLDAIGRDLAKGKPFCFPIGQ